MKKTIITVLLVFIIGFILSPQGLQIAAPVIANYYGVSFQQIQGSLLNNHIDIEGLAYEDDQTFLYVDRLQLSGFTLIPPNISVIQANTVETNLIPKAGSGGTSNFSSQSISVEKLDYRSTTFLQPVTFEQIEAKLSPQTKYLTCEYQNTPIYASITPSARPDLTFIELGYDHHTVRLAKHEHEKHTTFSSTFESHIQGILATHFHDEERLSLSINHQDQSTIQFNLALDLHTYDFEAHIDQIKAHLNDAPLQVSGEIFSKNHLITLDATYGNSYIKALNLTADQIILSANVDDLFTFSPYLKGGLELNINYTPNRIKAYAYSENLLLPLVKFSDLQLSYDSDSINSFHLSAAQLRNPLLLINQPSVSIQKINDTTHEVLALGLYNDAPQTLLATFTQTAQNLQVAFEKFNILTGDRSQWHLEQSAPVTLNQDTLTFPRISLSSNDGQSLSLSGLYHLDTHQWHLEHAAQNLEITFNSQGIIDDDTEVVLHHAILNGEGESSGQLTAITQNLGQYTLSDIHATVLNLVPSFSFPLDYHFTDSFLKWSDTGITGTLFSNQGNIQISSMDQYIHIHSPAIKFKDEENIVSGGVDLVKGPNRLSGHVDIHELKLSFDPNASFVSFPKEIHVIGDIPQPKPTASNIDIDLFLHFNDTPTSILGITGLGNGDINMQIPQSSRQESITGALNLQDPKLIILNRAIRLNHMSINYLNQPWDHGKIDLRLKQKTTITTNNETTNAEINLSVSGKLSSPGFDISTNPIHLSKDQSLTRILLASPLLPKGNENHRLLELISGLKRNEGVIVILQTLNNLSFFSLDISLRRGMNLEQSITPGFNDVELFVTKQLYDRLGLAFQKPLNEDFYTFSLDFKISPKLSIVGEYNSDEFFSINLLSNN